MAASVDPRCPWVKPIDGTNVKVERVAYLDGKQTRGNLGIYVFASYRKRDWWGTPFRLLLPGSWDEFATLSDFVIDMAGGLFYPDRGEDGPFDIVCGDARVEGMGLPANQHVIYIVTFGLRTVAAGPLGMNTSLIRSLRLPQAKVNRYKPMAQVSTRITKRRVTA